MQYLVTGKELGLIYNGERIEWEKEVRQADEELCSVLERLTEAEETKRLCDIRGIQTNLKRIEKRLENETGVKKASGIRISPKRLIESEQKLVEILGPIGTIVHQRAIEKKPQSEATLIEKITEQLLHLEHKEAYRASVRSKT